MSLQHMEIFLQKKHRSRCGKLARLLSAAAVVLAAGTLKIDVSSSSNWYFFFLLRGFHEDTHVCPCPSLPSTSLAVNSTFCKACCSCVSISNLQQWPSKSISGGASSRREPKDLHSQQLSCVENPALSVVLSLISSSWN